MIFPVKRVKEELINEFAVSNMDISRQNIHYSKLQKQNIDPEICFSISTPAG